MKYRNRKKILQACAWVKTSEPVKFLLYVFLFAQLLTALFIVIQHIKYDRF